jgi:hypothetical protein
MWLLALVRQIGHVPGIYDVAPTIRIPSDALDELSDLIDGFPILADPGSPLRPVHWTQIASIGSPIIPNGHTVLFQIFGVRSAPQEPEQLMHYRLDVQLLGCKERESLRQIVTVHAAKH